MKLVICFYNIALDSIVMEMLENLGVKTYTKIPEVQGVGTHSEPRLDTLVWPGVNNMLLIITGDEIKDKIIEEVKKLKKIYIKEGLKAIVAEITETT